MNIMKKVFKEMGRQSQAKEQENFIPAVIAKDNLNKSFSDREDKH